MIVVLAGLLMGYVMLDYVLSFCIMRFQIFWFLPVYCDGLEFLGWSLFTLWIQKYVGSQRVCTHFVFLLLLSFVSVLYGIFV